jgi:hypothetical protein
VQVDRLQILTQEDMKHSDRKLRHCLDEYALTSLQACMSSIIVTRMYSSLVHGNFFRHKKKEKKPKHKSKRTASDAGQ